MKSNNYILDEIELSEEKSSSSKNPSSKCPKHIVYDFTLNFINVELSSLTLTLPLIEPFNPVERLKSIPRTGKSVRLKESSFTTIKPRSIYDHVISMAHLADAFLELDKNKLIGECEYPNLGRLIAYHEINESLIGDIPAYTFLDGPSPKKENDIRIKNIPGDKRERIVNNFIWMFANNQQRASLEEMNRNLSQQNTPIMKYFRMLDRIDPIIAIWRYLYNYRDILQKEPESFVRAMNDFLSYPKTIAYKTDKYASDFPYLKDMLNVLMSPSAAIKYCKGTELKKLINSKTHARILKHLIEEVPLFVENE